MGFVERAVLTVADMMCAAAITAPKGRGVNLLFVKIFIGKEKNQVSDFMLEIGREKSIPFFIRDGKNVNDADAVVFIGTKVLPRNVPNCGFCGAENCVESVRKGCFCAYAVGDLGIAVGSAVSLAAHHHIDNRIMFSFGKAVIEGGFIPKEIKLGYGIPLSVNGKSIFFDRK